MSETSSHETVSEFELNIEQVSDFEFRVRFDKESVPPLIVDESPPLGRDAGPNPSRLLAAAVADCLTASLLFCARKARVELGPMKTRVRAETVRNERGRLRIGKIHVSIDPGLKAEDRERARRCLELFEDFCVVTQSVRSGLDVSVEVAGFGGE